MASSKDTSTQDMKGRILFTGSGDAMISDFLDHIPSRFEMMKCQPEEGIFVKTLEKYRPHVIIICLNNETRDMLRMYFVLENPEYIQIPVFVVGRESDCMDFDRRVKLKNVEIFVRPFDRSKLVERLDTCVAPALKAAGNAEAQPPEPSVAAPGGPVERKSILVVDDDIPMLNVIKIFLQDLYEVTIVPSGKLALKFLAKKHADLVLLDYLMPEMDGPSTLQQIRESSNCPDIPVVILTGVDDKEMVLRCLEYHPNGYLLKPIKRDLLLEKVMEILLGI